MNYHACFSVSSDSESEDDQTLTSLRATLQEERESLRALLAETKANYQSQLASSTVNFLTDLESRDFSEFTILKPTKDALDSTKNNSRKSLDVIKAEEMVKQRVDEAVQGQLERLKERDESILEVQRLIQNISFLDEDE
jgi:hypothetical protein